jgi:hypothetical protein
LQVGHFQNSAFISLIESAAKLPAYPKDSVFKFQLACLRGRSAAKPQPREFNHKDREDRKEEMP